MEEGGRKNGSKTFLENTFLFQKSFEKTRFLLFLLFLIISYYFLLIVICYLLIVNCLIVNCLIVDCYLLVIGIISYELRNHIKRINIKLYQLVMRN